ncbi:unnamed protein product [Closterium sp. NIES-53]
MRLRFGSGDLGRLSATCLRTSCPPVLLPTSFLASPLDAPGWQFYHPTSRRVLSSQDVTFDESVPYYRLFPYRTASLPTPPLFLAPGPPPVDPLPPQGPAPSGVSQVDAVEPVKVAFDSGAATGAEPAGAGSGGAESGGAETEGAEPGGAELAGAETGGTEPWGAEPGGTEPGGAEPGGGGSARVASRGAEPGGTEPGGAGTGGAEPWGAESGGAEPGGAGSARVASRGASSRREVLSPQELREWFARRWGRAAGAGGTTAATGSGVSAGASGGTGAAGSAGTGASGATGVGAAGGVGAGETADAGPSEGAGAGAVGAGGAAGAGAAAERTGAVPTGSGGATRPRPYFVPLLEQVLGLPLFPGRAPPLECPQPVQSQSPLQPVSPLPAPSPYTGPTEGLSERRVPASRPTSPARPACTSRRTSRPRPPSVPGTHQMTLRPSTAPLRVPLPSPPASSLPVLADPASNSLRAAIAELVDFAARCRLDYTASLVAESASVCPPFVEGECALGTDVLEDRQEEFQCFAAALPHLVSTLLAPEGDADAPDIPTPRSYAEAIDGPYSSQWKAAMEQRWLPGSPQAPTVKRPPGSPPVFKARYVARGFSLRQGVDYFQTFSLTPKMTTLRVLLHIAAQRDYELHSLDFSTAFLQGSLHEEIWLRRPPGFTRSTTLAALGIAPSTTDPSLFLRTDTSLPPFYVLVYVDDLVFATAATAKLAHMKSELQKRHTCTDLGELRSYLGLQITRDRAQRTITLTQSHMVQQVLQRFDLTYSLPQATPLSTRHSLSALPSDESVEPSGPYPELVGCLMYLMTCTRPDLAYPLSILARYVAPGRHQPEHMAAAKRVTDLGEPPCSPPVLYANTADIFTKAFAPGDHLRFCTMLACFALFELSCDLLFSPTLPMGTSLMLRTSGLLPLVRSAAAERARVAGVVEVVAVVVEVAAGVVVGAAVEVVEAVEVVAAVGLVAGVGAVGLVAVGLDLGVEAVVVASGISSILRSRTSRPSSSTCGKLHTQHRSFSRLDDAWRAEFGDKVEHPRWEDLLSTLPGTAPAQALNSLTLDSGASHYLFRDSTILTPLPALVMVRLVDPSGGPVVARFSTVLPCPVVPSGSLSGLHLPLFFTNLVSTAALQDAMVTTTTPRGQRVSICTCTRTGRLPATFTHRQGSSLYTLATEPPQVAASAQVSASGLVAASCSCCLLSHLTLLWHHRLGQPSLPRLCGMHSHLLISGLPRSLPPLPPSPALPCLPCVEGRQRVAPHSSSFPPTTAPLQTLHMDGQVVDVLIPWIRTVRLQLHERLGHDLPVLRLHSDRGGEFSSDLLREFFCGEGILQLFMLPDSPQQNGIAERRIGLVMKVAPQPLALCLLAKDLAYIALDGEVGDASAFRVWGSRAFVRDTFADKLSTRAIPCVFLGFVPDAPGWQFYHPTLRCVLPSQEVTFDASVPFYHLFP